jgi:ATP-binding cassette subfamily C (CFTR/MRP) protein 1
VVYLAKFSTSSPKLDRIYVASLVISIPVVLLLSLIFVLEPQYSVFYLDLATIYLVFSTLCDVVLVTMPSGISIDDPRSEPIIARSISQSVVLVLGCCASLQKPSISKPLSPEEKFDILSRIFFFWINPILLQGYKQILTDTDLPPLSQDLKSKATRRAVLQAWDRRCWCKSCFLKATVNGDDSTA